jgi:hypothetical protein
VCVCVFGWVCSLLCMLVRMHASAWVSMHERRESWVKCWQRLMIEHARESWVVLTAAHDWACTRELSQVLTAAQWLCPVYRCTYAKPKLVCIPVLAHIYWHTCIHTRMDTHMYMQHMRTVREYVLVRAHINAYMRAFRRVNGVIRNMSSRIRVCVCVCVCVYACVITCIYLHAHIHMCAKHFFWCAMAIERSTEPNQNNISFCMSMCVRACICTIHTSMQSVSKHTHKHAQEAMETLYRAYTFKCVCVYAHTCEYMHITHVCACQLLPR